MKDRAFEQILDAEPGSREISEMVNTARAIDTLRRKVVWKISGHVDWDDDDNEGKGVA